MNRTLSTGALALATALTSEARAQDWSLHATGSVGAAYDDNILGASRLPPPGSEQVPILEDYVISAQPGLTFYYTTPRVVSSVSYARSYFFYVRHPEADTTADTVTGAMAYALSPVDELGATAIVSRASSSLSTLAAPSESRAVAGRVDPAELLTITLGQTLIHGIDDRWSLSEVAASTHAFPLDTEEDSPGSPFASISGLVGPRYDYERHTFLLDVGLLYARTFVPEAADLHLFVPSMVVGWGFRLSDDFTTNITAGAALPVDSNGNAAIAPLASAGIGYQHPEGYGAALVVATEITPSPEIPAIFYNHSATLSGTIPLYAPIGFGLDASAGIAANRVVAEGVVFSDNGYNTWITDVGIGLRPPDFPLSLSVRYQHSEQLDATGNTDFDIKRNVGTIVVGYIVPPLGEERARELRSFGNSRIQRTGDDEEKKAPEKKE